MPITQLMPNKYVLDWIVATSIIISIKLYSCFPVYLLQTSAAASFHAIFPLLLKTKNETVTLNPMAFLLLKANHPQGFSLSLLPYKKTISNIFSDVSKRPQY